MQSQKRVLSSVALVAVAFVMVIGQTVFMTGQEAPKQTTVLVDDWTHHHLIFPNPGTAADALKNGTIEQWYRIVNDPRYKLQQLKRSATQRAVANAPDFAARLAVAMASKPIPVVPKPKRNPIKKDWSMGLEGKPATITGTLTANDAGSTSSVTIDGVTISAAAATNAKQTGTFYLPPQNGAAPILVTNGTNSLTISTNASAQSETAAFTSPPTASGTITVPSGANTLTLTTNATQGTYSNLTFTGSAHTTSTIAITYTGGTSSNTLTMTGGTSNSCGSSTAGTFNGSTNSSSSRAGNLISAIGMCPAAVGISAAAGSGGSSTVTLTTTLPGQFLTTVTNNLSNTTNGTLSSGSNGYNFCSGESPTFTATYASSNSTATLLSNLIATINSCPASAGVSASGSTVTDTILGANTFGGSGYSSFFTWTVVNAGSAGSPGCTSTGPSYTATYATSSSTTTLAGNLSSVIGTTCLSAVRTALGISSVGSSTNTVTLTATSGAGGDSITVAPTSGYFAWAAGNLTGGDGTTATPSSTTTFGYTGSISATQVAANIATAINNNTTLQLSTGVTATSGTCNTNQGCVYVTARATGGSALTNNLNAFPDFSWGSSVAGTSGTSAVLPNAYPAKYSFTASSASCNDIAIYPTGTSGTNVPSIVAYTNLYSGCSGAVPTVSWAYATGGAVTTSPLLSFSDNGAQAAFIQVSGTTASLVLIKWAAGGGTLTSPVTPTNSLSGSAYRLCTPTATTPCMFTIAFNGSPNDTFSSPFDDYFDDTIYVGDDSGKLHLFTGVFEGTPAEVYASSGGCGSTCNWPVLLNSSNKVSSPVYAVTGAGNLVFVGDFGGYFYFVTGGVSGGTKTTTLQYGDVFADAPLVDASHNLAYAFVTTGNSNTDPNYNLILQFSFCCGVPSAFSGFQVLGTGATTHYLYAGAFDDMYFNNASPYAYGNIYVVGGTGAKGGGELYQVSIQQNSMPSVTSVKSVNSSSGYPWPSPVTELCCNPNTGADLIFFSVNYPASGLGCTSGSGDGCILAYDVSNPSSITQEGTGLTVTTPGTNGCYATGGIVVDNVSDLAGASQIYFVGLNGANAAGVPTGGSGASGCTAATAVTLATQALQASP